jgi:hypothetical protein
MYLEILNENMVGYANISARDMLNHLFETYGNITAVDLEINFEHMRRPWDPQQPVESLFKQIQDCDDYSEAGGVPIGPSHQINVGYAKIFATGQFMSACRRWNEKPAAEKTWTHLKSHFAAAHRQHKHMKGETAAHAGIHSANAPMTQTEDHMAEARRNSNCGRQRCVGSSNSGQISSCQTTRGNFVRVERIEGFAPPGTARQAGPKKCQRNCKQLLLDSWLQGGKDSHTPHLQHS